MIGLRQYERDLDLPARLGDPDRRVLEEREVLDLVARLLPEAGDAPPTAARCEFARWKPHVAITSVHEVEFEDGARRLVTLKRHAGAKARSIASDGAARVVRDGDLLVALYPWDRELRGIERLVDVRRTARLLEESGWCAARAIKKRRAHFELLRFKPERRAVYRVELRLRGDGESSSAVLAARVLPPGDAARVVSARGALGKLDFAPNLVASDVDAGLCFEEWLDVEPLAFDAFEAAHEAGELLARLHRRPGPDRADAADVAPPDWRVLETVVDAPSTVSLRSALDVVDPAPTVWTHGDFHPDQIARGTSGTALLDLDAVAPRPASEDLATWAADALAYRDATTLDEALGPILAGYEEAGGVAPRREDLTCSTARALARLAAGSLRRLEANACCLAAERLGLAHRILREVAP